MKNLLTSLTLLLMLSPAIACDEKKADVDTTQPTTQTDTPPPREDIPTDPIEESSGLSPDEKNDVREVFKEESADEINEANADALAAQLEAELEAELKEIE